MMSLHQLHQKALRLVKRKHIPEKFLPLIGKAEYGPNCWNTTMAFHEDCEFRYVSPSEKGAWLKDRTVEAVGPRQRGDIMVLRAGPQLVHTAIWINKSTMLQKYGVENDWQIVSQRTIVRQYKIAFDTIEWRRYVGPAIKAA